MKNTIRQKEFKALLLAGLLSRLVNVSGNLVDSFVVGNFCGGADALAAMGLLSPLINFGFFLPTINSIAANALAAKRLAVLDTEGANAAFNTAMLLSLIVSLLLMLPCILFPASVISFLSMGKDLDTVQPLACDYLIGYAPTIPFIALNSILIPFLGLDGSKRRLRLFTFTILVTNIALDLVIAFFLGGSIMAIGLATAFANIAGFVILSSHCFRSDVTFRFELKINHKQLAAFFASLPMATSTATGELAHVAEKLLMNVFVLSTATASCGFASLSIQGRFTSLEMILIMGISNAMFVLIGMAYARSSRAEIKEIFYICLKYILLSLIIVAAMLIFSPWLARLFLDDETVYPYVRFAVCAVAVSLPFELFNFAFRNYLQASKRTGFASVISILQDALVIPFALALVPRYGLYGVLAAVPSSNIFLSFLLYTYVAIKTKRLFPGIEGILLLPEDFGTDLVEQRRWIITDADSVIACSQSCYDFFLSHGVDKRHCYYLSLFVEESAMNTLKHGFKDGREHLVQIIASYKSDGECILYQEDDCRHFDPIEKRRMMKECKSDGPQHIGLRLICSLAEDIKYINTMNTNTVMVKYKG